MWKTLILLTLASFKELSKKNVKNWRRGDKFILLKLRWNGIKGEWFTVFFHIANAWDRYCLLLLKKEKGRRTKRFGIRIVIVIYNIPFVRKYMSIYVMVKYFAPTVNSPTYVKYTLCKEMHVLIRDGEILWANRQQSNTVKIYPLYGNTGLNTWWWNILVQQPTVQHI